MGRRPVRIEHAPSKQRGKRLGADDRTGESPDRGPHRDEVAAATIDERIGQVIGDVVLHGLVAEGRHRAVGERLGPQHRAPQVRHHQREQRQHHSNAAERPIHEYVTVTAASVVKQTRAIWRRYGVPPRPSPHDRLGRSPLNDRPPLPPFTRETAAQKVQAAENAWNTRDPDRVALAYTEDSVWRNRDTFLNGRAEIVAFLSQKWDRELEYSLRKNLWAFDENRIAVRFQYESCDRDGQWWRSYGNELWEFDEHGLMMRREASINDVRIDEGERRIHGSRPESEQDEQNPVR